MNISVHDITRIEILPVEELSTGKHHRNIVLTDRRGESYWLTLFGQNYSDLALTMKGRVMTSTVYEADSASAPDAAVATSEVAL